MYFPSRMLTLGLGLEESRGLPGAPRYIPTCLQALRGILREGKALQKEKPPGKILSSEKRPRKHLRIHRPAAGLTA